MDYENKSSFDKLVAGLNAEDRINMLKSINQGSMQRVPVVEEIDTSDKNVTLTIKFQNESFLYKFYIWLKSLFTKNQVEAVYNDDLIAGLAKKINRNHPGTVNHKIHALDYIFYERLQALKESADFFRPYFAFITESPGDFYVFLSSFVAPELSEKINKEADPFINPFSKTGGPDVRNDLLRKLDAILKDMDEQVRLKIYAAVSTVNWLNHFVALPYLHFMAQFTNVAGDVYTANYMHSKHDFNEFASVFAKIVPVDNEILESIYLFSQKKNLNENVQEKDVEKAVRDFMGKAVSYLATVQDFPGAVSITRLGRVVNNDYEWEPENMEGAESWYVSFRNQWHKIFDIRWNEWLRAQKKTHLSENLNIDFGLADFPELKYKPWTKMWSSISFGCELTGGFLSWFVTEKYDEIIMPLNEVMMEGIFIKSENRTEYSEALNDFVNASSNMKILLEKLSPKGDYGKLFEEFATNQVHTLQVQNQINSMMKDTEGQIREYIKQFCKGARTMDRVFHGFFDESKDGIHEGLQNLNTIKGRESHAFRDQLIEIRDLLRKCLFYISELEPIDQASD